MVGVILPRLSVDQWSIVRTEYESGVTQTDLSKKHGVSRKAIQKHIEAEGWCQDVEPAIKRKVAEKVARCDFKKLAESIDAEAERRAEVERRHREEPNACRERIHAGLEAHRNAATKEEKKIAFEDLKAAKISAEAMMIVHNMERKAWRLDVPDAAQQQQSMDIQVVYVDETKTI